MKKLLLPLLLFVSTSSFAQMMHKKEALPVDLRIEQDADTKKGKTFLITGISLNVAGIGAALLADELVGYPEMDMTPEEYAYRQRIAGDNAEAQQLAADQFLASSYKYAEDIEAREKKVDTIKAIGITSAAVGVGFDIAGIMKLFK